MAHDLSAGDLTTIRQDPFYVKKYVSIAPRLPVYTAQLNVTILQDSVSDGIYAFDYDNGVGTLSDIKVGMSIDIGTTPGGRDIGTTHVRKAPTGTRFFIPETSPGLLLLADNQYITVVNEHRPHRKIVRLVSTKVNSLYYNNFIEYHDYDVTYSNQNANIEPKANITEAGLKPARPAGWVDSGQTYRTVDLDSSLSVALASGATISSRSWDVADGTITVGTSSSTAITVTFPDSSLFRYVSLTVTDSLGTTGIMYFPIWVHNDTTNIPIAYLTNGTGFTISKDDTEAGRTMEFQFFGEVNGIDETVLPEGTLVCYWEEADFAGDDPPDTYRTAFLGWATRDSALSKLDESTYTVEIAGLQYWLDKFDSFSQTISDPSGSVNKWYYMDNITSERVAHYVLRGYSDMLRLGNLYLRGYTAIIKEEEIKKASLWAQLTELLLAGHMTGVGVDSLNGIWFAALYEYLTDAERLAITPIIDLDTGDWTHDGALILAEDKSDKVSIVDATGSSWLGGSNISRVWASRAPGSVPGTVAGTDTLPYQRLPSATAQADLDDLVGFHYGKLNNHREPVTITLTGNYDVIEPCWREPITLTWQEDTVRGLELVSQEFLVKSVSIRHNDEVGQPSKVIQWTLDWATTGEAGFEQPVPDTNTPLAQPISPTSPDYGNGGISFPNTTTIPTGPAPVAPATIDTSTPILPGRTGLRNTDVGVFVTLDIVPEDPTWIDITPATFFTAFVMAVWERSSPYSHGVYVLGNDGSDSKIAYNPDPFADPTDWSYGTLLDGIYTNIDNLETLAQAGSVNAYLPGGGSTTITESDDLTSGLGPNSHLVSATYPFNTYNSSCVADRTSASGGAYVSNNGRTGGGSIHSTVTDCSTKQEATLIIDFGGAHTVVEASFWHKNDDISSQSSHIRFWDASKTLIHEETWASDSSLTYKYEVWTGSIADIRYVSFHSLTNLGDIDSWIDDCLASYNDGGGGGSDAIVVHSNNYGSTTDYEIVGTSPTTGEAAFAGNKTGVVTVAAADAKLRIATAESGSYADASQGATAGTYPICARIPWYKIGSLSSKNLSTTPDYYLASAALVSGEALWKIVSGVKTAITPSVSGTKGIGVSSNCIGTWKGQRIVYIADVSATRYIFTSTNAGSSWVQTAIPSAVSVRARRQSTSGLEWLVAAGTSGLYWSDDGGIVWKGRGASGNNLYAELFG